MIVTDRGKKECVDPKGNGVTRGRGLEVGPGPPSEEQDKQLICNSGGDKTSMGGARRTTRRAQCDIKTSSRTEYVTL